MKNAIVKTDFNFPSQKNVYKGKDCEILDVDSVELISTDFQNHFPMKAVRVSRHIAPNEFIEIELSNGRNIVVTPEHPCFVVEDGKIKTVSAGNLKKGIFFPVPSKINVKTKS